MRERVNFGIEIDRETDATIKQLAMRERRSKRNFHATIMNRIARLWKEQPDELRRLNLVRDEPCQM